jgi:hypothetical protein
MIEPPRQAQLPGEVTPQFIAATKATFTAMTLFDEFDSAQRLGVVLPFDDENRLHFNFLPESGRRGVRLRDMNHKQQILVHRLIVLCMTVEGYSRVLSTINLEHLLREINQPLMGHLALDFRDPGNYFFAFFGQPNPDIMWGWRLVGHHVSLNFTIHNQEWISSTPSVIGAEPARFGAFRSLAAEEDLGFDLLRSLTAEQRERAVIHSVSPAELVTRVVPHLGEEERPPRHGDGRRDVITSPEDAEALRYLKAHPRGIAAGELDGKQRAKLEALVECYLERSSRVMGEMDRIRDAGFDALHFAWAGGTDYDEGHYYRVQGPVTVIEFNNTEDGANHAHSVWRDPTRDFGAGDPLFDHLRAEHRTPAEHRGTHSGRRLEW